MFQALSIPLTNELIWVLKGSADSSSGAALDPENFVIDPALPTGWKGLAADASAQRVIAVKAGSVRLLETVTYEWRVIGEGAESAGVAQGSFTMSGASEWTLTSWKGEAPR